MGSAPVQIAGLELGDEIGRGAHSVVYRGERQGRPCAIKIARRVTGASRWFRREAAALARVGHPGVPRVLDVGEVDDRPYLVMELVEGESLHARLEREPLTIEQILDLAEELASIATAVHARGLVHRDIKPTNIVIDNGGVVHLVDFGLVMQTHPQLDNSHAGGTRTFAAPEQLHTAQIVDARADLYAIGQVIHACLSAAGVTPPHAVREVLRHVRAHDPAARYGSASAFAADLQRARRGEPLMGPIASTDHPAEDPLVGRDRELQHLRTRWAACMRGQGGVLVLEGPPGSGKTKLLDHFVAELDAAGHHALLRTEGSLALPFGSAQVLVERWLDRIERMAPESGAERLRALRNACAGPAESLLASLSPRLAHALANPAPPPERDHEAFAEAVAALVVKLARADGPMLLVVDDLQWLDPLSREILVRVALEAHDVPLLFVAAARADARSLAPVQRFTRSLGRDRLDVVAMSPLGEPDLGQLVSAHLDCAAPDDRLVHLVVGLCDGTPFGAIELLGALVDSGALRPHWGTWRFEPRLADRTRLPVGTTGLLDRRVARLPPATLKVLQAAAILGPRFHAETAAAVAGIDALDIGYALVDADRAALVVSERDGTHKFVHESVREAILRPIAETDRRALHQRAAEILDREGGIVDVQVVAHHYANGQPERTPKRALRAAVNAARSAAAQLDHETALLYFDLAERMATIAAVDLDAEFFRGQAESRFRVGAMEESLPCFRKALALTEDTLGRVELLGRIAWVYQALADPDRAWATLEQAFDMLDERMPTERPPAVARTLSRALKARALRGFAGAPGPRERARLELLCELHYQTGRLGVEYNKPFRTLLAAMTVLATGERLGPSAALARAMATYGAFMTTLGRRSAGLRYLTAGQAMAERVRDASAVAYTLQLHSAGLAWAGDLDRALQLGQRCIDEHGPWLEVSEFCLLAANGRATETVRGRVHEALAWSRRAVGRVRRHGRIPVGFEHVVAAGIRASLATCGRDSEEHHLALHELAAPPPEVDRGLHRLVAWGPRAVELAGTGRVHDELDALVEEFTAERHDPRRVHIVVVEYYVAVAQAYGHRCLTAKPGDLLAARQRFDRALADLTRAARLPLFKAHVRALEGLAAMLDGNNEAARAKLAEAEQLGTRENAPWVLYTVARTEAHLLRREGKHDAARDRAKVAALLAREHGAVHRQRWVEQEFELVSDIASSPSSEATGGSQSTRSRRQLRAYLEVVRASPREKSLAGQAHTLLDEMIRAAGASRGLLLFERPGTTKRLLEGRFDDGTPWSPTDGWLLKLMSRVCDAGVALHEDASLTADLLVPIDPTHTLAIPLALHDERCGALYLERNALGPGFGPADLDVVSTLAPQVPVTLELARLLEEREQLEDDLRRAQRMEAVGQLASGIAHDFNNMLTAIRSSLELLGGSKDEEDRQESIATIYAAYERAAELTRQLLAFSRRQVLEAEVIDLGAAVADLEGIVRRIVGGLIDVQVIQPEAIVRVRTDRSSLEQALVNLAANARDAMPDGGTLRIAVEEVVLDETWLVRGAVSVGRHACIEVTDSGVGMPREILDKIFEPFFTTKSVGQGTGLGLASVHGFVTQAGGHIEVTSKVGVGSSFRIYLPATFDEPTAVSPDLPAPTRPGTVSILVVDDDHLVRRSVATALSHQGYTVYDVANGQAAIDHIQSEGAVDLVVTDVVMPVMSGPEFARQLERAGIRIPILFISGYPSADLVDHGVLREGVEYLRKPFATTDLIDRIRALLPQRAANVGVR